MAMKKDLDELKSRDKDLQRDGGSRQPSSPPPQPGTASAEDTPDMMSEDMRRDLLRQKWEQEEEENLRKTKLHYRDVLYDEARTHGAAFYNFSRDETKRTEELDNLEAMHKDTEATRSANDRAKAKRKAALALRLKKVRDRKRLKMGLPVSSEDAAEEDQDLEGCSEDEEDREKKMDTMVLAGLREMRDLQEKAKKEEEVARKMKRHGPREWDLGKDGLDEITARLGRSKESRVFSQQEWVDKQRNERSNDFAPPSAYEKPKPSYSNFVKGPQQSPTKPPPNLPKPVPAKKFSKPPPSVPSGPPRNFAVPPPGFSSPPPSVPPPSRRPPQSAPPNPYQNEFGPYEPGPSTSHQGPSFSPPVTLPKPSMSSRSRLQLHKEMMDNWGEGSGADTSDTPARGRGAEIEPPCQMDYYAGSSKESSAPRLPVVKSSMADAFAAGLSNQLKHFRNQSGAAVNNTESDDDSD